MSTFPAAEINCLRHDQNMPCMFCISPPPMPIPIPGLMPYPPPPMPMAWLAFIFARIMDSLMSRMNSWSFSRPSLSIEKSSCSSSTPVLSYS